MQNQTARCVQSDVESTMSTKVGETRLAAYGSRFTQKFPTVFSLLDSIHFFEDASYHHNTEHNSSFILLLHGVIRKGTNGNPHTAPCQAMAPWYR